MKHTFSAGVVLFAWAVGWAMGILFAAGVLAGAR
jgi:hypothetical protein